MRRTQETVVVVLLTLIVLLLVLNLMATRFETKVAQAGGGGHQGTDGWIAFSGQKADGPETVYVFNSKRGDPRKSGKYTFTDNGPRLAVYRVNSQGKLKLSSMRNVGPDIDEWIDAFYPDTSGPSVREVKKQNKEARQIKESGGATEDDDDDDAGMPSE